MSIQLNQVEAKQEIKQEANNSYKNVLAFRYEKRDKSISSLFNLLPNLHLVMQKEDYDYNNSTQMLEEVNRHTDNMITTMTWANQAVASLIFLASSNEDFPLDKGDLVDLSSLLHLLSDGIDAAYVAQKNVEGALRRRQK